MLCLFDFCFVDLPAFCFVGVVQYSEAWAARTHEGGDVVHWLLEFGCSAGRGTPKRKDCGNIWAGIVWKDDVGVARSGGGSKEWWCCGVCGCGTCAGSWLCKQAGCEHQ